jgi:hypothetical protein
MSDSTPDRFVRTVALVSGQTIKVYPVRYSQQKAFRTQIEKAARDLLSPSKDVASPVIAMLEEVLGLVDVCTVPRMSEVDPFHWEVATIVREWIAVNFEGEEQKKAWRGLLKTFLQQTGIDEKRASTIWSRFSSAAGSTLRKLTEAKTTTAGPTEDGPSPSSAPVPQPSSGGKLTVGPAISKT